MTREEAKELLTHILMTYEPRDQYGYLNDPEPYEEAMAMAIEVLSESKTGQWIYLHGSIGSYMTISCSFCGETFNDVAEWKYNYCPNCGSYNGGWEE